MTPPKDQDGSISLIGTYAGFASRLAAFIIDLVVISVCIIAFSWFFHTTLQMLQIERLMSTNNLLKSIYDFIVSPLCASLATIVFIIFYYVFFWTLAGQTVGKAVMGIKIIPNQGGKMSILRSILRYFGYYLSALPIGIGFLWILWDDRRMSWHDRLANTCVVYIWDARPDENFLVLATEQLISRREALRRIIQRRKKNKKVTSLEEPLQKND